MHSLNSAAASTASVALRYSQQCVVLRWGIAFSTNHSSEKMVGEVAVATRPPTGAASRRPNGEIPDGGRSRGGPRANRFGYCSEVNCYPPTEGVETKNIAACSPSSVATVAHLVG